MSKTKDRSFSDTILQAVKPGTLFACLLLAVALPAQAQQERQYPFLVFDPVGIELPAPAATAGDLQAAARELDNLPTADSVSLSRWLRDSTTLQGNGPPPLTSDIADYERSIQELEATE